MNSWLWRLVNIYPALRLSGSWTSRHPEKVRWPRQLGPPAALATVEMPGEREQKLREEIGRVRRGKAGRNQRILFA